MSSNMQSDIKTLAYVLRRTNYGEADRILNLITPQGKIAAVAKGVRRPKSKLAGGVEMFSLIELNVHQGKSDLGVITSARMLKYYNKILADFERMELAAMVLKKISLAAESSDSPEYFKLVDQSLIGLNVGVDKILVESWFTLNLLKASGEEVNVYRDIDGNKLQPKRWYVWDALEKVFVESENGEYGTDEIKMLRLMLSNDLMVVARVKNFDSIVSKILAIVRALNK